VVFGVQHRGKQHRELAVRGEVLDPLDAVAVPGFGARELRLDRPPEPRRHFAVLELLDRDVVAPERRQREVHPPQFFDVLPDVTDEVRQLKRLAEGHGVRAGRLRLVRLHDRRHHVADRGRRAPHVRLQIIVGLVAIGVDVGDHRVDERVDLLVGNPRPRSDLRKGRNDRLLGRLLAERGASNRLEFGPLGGGLPVETVVDDLVCDPKKSVEDVSLLPDPLRKEPGCVVERFPGLPVDCLTPLALGVVHTSGMDGRLLKLRPYRVGTT